MQPEPQVEDTFGVVTAEEAAKKDEPQDLLPLPHEMLEAAEEQIQRVETRLERYNQQLTVCRTPVSDTPTTRTPATSARKL